MTTSVAPVSASDTLRAFIRANAKLDGALEALDALMALESAAQTAAGEREREAAYSAAIVDAQRDIQPAYKDKFIPKVRGGGPIGPNTPGVNVAETQQILGLCREEMAKHGLALEVGELEVISIGGAMFLRVRYGLRHRAGFVRSVSRDFPLGNGATNPDTVRGANTSALGYYLIDAFALPRLTADSLQAEAERARARSAPQSGPRRAGAPGPAATTQAPSAQPKAPPPANKPPSVESVKVRIAKADLSGLDGAREWLDGVRFDMAQDGDGPYTAAQVAEMAAAIEARRVELGA